jgi:DNA-binding MarR family transcriptional regulator
MDFKLIKEIVDKLEQYEASIANNTQLTSTGFATYLLTNENFESDALNTGDKNHIERMERLGIEADSSSVESAISQLIVFMYRYAKQYIKKALKHTDIKTIDEFTYLSTLLAFNSLSKMELINKSMQEKTTGMETIKRLLKANLIAQSNNPNDQRSQLIHLTDQGKQVLFSAFGTMQTVLKIIPGNLTTNEKVQLAFLLKKLDVHHNHIFMNKRDVALEDLVHMPMLK